MITSFNLSFAIFERCDLPNVKIGKLEIDQPGLLAQGPDEKKALSGFAGGCTRRTVVFYPNIRGDTRAAHDAARGAKGPYPPGPRPRSHYAQPGRKVQSLQPS